MQQGKAFDQMTPPLSVTDPRGLGLTAYPKHLHKAGPADDGGPLYVEVQTPQQEAEAIADGWLLERPTAPLAETVPRGPAPRRR